MSLNDLIALAVSTAGASMPTCRRMLPRRGKSSVAMILITSYAAGHATSANAVLCRSPSGEGTGTTEMSELAGPVAGFIEVGCSAASDGGLQAEQFVPHDTQQPPGRYGVDESASRRRRSSSHVNGMLLAPTALDASSYRARSVLCSASSGASLHFARARFPSADLLRWTSGAIVRSPRPSRRISSCIAWAKARSACEWLASRSWKSPRCGKPTPPG